MDQHLNAGFVPVVADELEQLILQEIARRIRVGASTVVLDFPCGDGRHGAAMAQLGAQVTAADLSSREIHVQGRAMAAGVTEQLQFLTVDMRQGPLPEGPFDLIFCHHGIHRLPYGEARQLVRSLIKSMRIGGKLFISAYGLHSALGEGYADQDKPVESRFGELNPALAERYGIKGPVCLYTERNLVTLLFEAGGSVLKTFTTTHGTVKGVAVRV